ncbi:MAG: LysM peptidoglycan-binding domain-containing protein [Tannerella sp.]|nr:LysM peptidoglycan-binding domain-containing protein [Tannerella sp.]
MRRSFILFIIFCSCFVSQTLKSQGTTPQVSFSNGQDGNIFYHTVERGQTIYGISTMYGVTEDEIYRLNPGSREYIKVGEKLKIPQKEMTASSTGRVEDMYIFHTIQSKETLYGVSKQYNVTLEQITKANPGLTSQTFSAGKIIRIPAVEIASLPTTEIKTVVKEIEYKIKKKETMYSLCKRFDTTSDKLIQYNPELKSGLKAGMVIKIPVETEETVTTYPNQNEFNIDALIAYRNEIQKVSVVKIGLLLSFKSSDAKLAAARTEFYEGFLMAVDSLKKKGVSVDLTVYDIGDGVQKTKEALQTEALRSCHLIIGGTTNEQIELMAAYALKNGIKYVVPFSKCDKLTSENGAVFQVNTSYQNLYSYATTRACELFANYNVIIVNTQDKDEKDLFIRTLKANMAEVHISYRELSFNERSFQADISSMLSTTKPNLVIPISGSLEALAKINAPLRMIADTKSNYNLTLFGHPEWQKYTNDYVEDFFKLNAHMYTSFYANNLSPDVQRFTNKYYRLYKKSMIVSYPKYAMLGFDTGMYFISAINQWGSNFEDNIQSIKHNSLQTGFNFQRVNNWGGFVNTNLYFVRYNKDHTITRF